VTFKIALIYSFESSPSVSCQKIVSNLLLAYAPFNHDHEIFHLNYNTEESMGTWEGIKQILHLRPDYVVFLDHRPHPLAYVDLLKELSETEDDLRSKFIFHLYSDFNLNLEKWERLFKIIENHTVYFFVATEEQKTTLLEFIPEHNLGICPIPVHADEFHYSSELRKQARSKNHWQEDETVFLFAGTQSEQNQIHVLLSVFNDWRKQNNANARLVLVGEVESKYIHQIMGIVSSFDSETQERIEFHGFKANEQLVDFLNGADCFVNLSLKHDEEYELSLAEVQATGLPFILSNSELTSKLSERYNIGKTQNRGESGQQRLSEFGIDSVNDIIQDGFNKASSFKRKNLFLKSTTPMTVKLSTHDKLWPSSDVFFHPWNPVFSDSIQNQGQLELYPQILLRDGALSLLDFFLRFPKPSKKSSRLIVHADLSFLVPEEWRETTKCFRMNATRKSKPTSRLIFYHLLNDMPLDTITTSERFQSWLSQFPKNAEVEIFLGLREKQYPTEWTERRDCFEMMTDFQFHFKNKVHMISLEELKHRGTDPEFTYINMDVYRSGLALCSIDSYMMSHSCQLSPQLIDQGFKGQRIEKSPLSFNHEFELFDFKNDNSDFYLFETLKNISNKSDALPFPIIPELMDLLIERLSAPH
jgi:glycosyltransferase involved in cell wall biosynthesis